MNGSSAFFVAMSVALCGLAAGQSSMYDAIFLAQNFSGVVAARVGSATNTEYKKAFGKFNYQFDIPMPKDARFPVASNTKLYVAISLYQLQEAGKVNLSRNVADYLDASDFASFGIQNQSTYCPHLAESPSSCLNLTFVQLLEMSGGVPDLFDQYLPFPGSIGLVVGRYILHPLLFKPGTDYYYSNPSFMFLAYFVEKLSGKGFGTYLRDHIIDPLGLNSTTTYYDQQDEMFHYDPKRVSEFHRFIDPNTKESVSIGKCTSELQLGSANGAGGLVSTLDDEAKLYFAVFNFTGAGHSSAGGGILTKESLYEIIKPRNQLPRDPANPMYGRSTYYGQGIFVKMSGSGRSNNGGGDDSQKQQLPQQIFYGGAIKCVYSANVLDLSTSPVTMGQAYTNTPVFYGTRAQVEEARRSSTGSFAELIASGNFSFPIGPVRLSEALIEAVNGHRYS